MNSFCSRFQASLIFAFLLFTSCSDDSSSPSAPQKYPVVMSVEDLGECGENQQGDSIYASLENIHLTCQDGFWTMFEPIEEEDAYSSESSNEYSSESNSDSDTSSSESNSKTSSASDSSGTHETIHTSLNLYVATDDTMPSLKYLPECNSSHEGRYVFIASLNGYLKCTDEKWLEYTPDKDATPYKPFDLNDTTFNTGKSDLNNYFDIEDSLFEKSNVTNSDYYYYRSTDSTLIKAEDILGKCDNRNDDALVLDTARTIRVSYDHLYYCSNGVWSGVTKNLADTLGFGKAAIGTFRIGRANAPIKLSRDCDDTFSKAEHQVYVYDERWRKADFTELCYNKACTSKNNGVVITFKETSYICNENKWDEVPVEEPAPTEDTDLSKGED